MSRDPVSDTAGLFLVFAIVGTLLVLAIFVTPIAIAGILAYAGYRLYTESPARLERLARAETETLYLHALEGTVALSDAEIDEALCRHWPPDLPGALKVQLLDVGRALFEQEGLSPDIPPPPALCNTVEGARYRDMLAKAGQARSDRTMVLSALDILSEALAPIANAVPPVEGDVLIEVTQFTQPLGQTIQNVIAPFFRDSEYMHFKALRQRLDANLTATHRSNPIFPADYKGENILDTYLRGTYLKDLFALRTPFAIPEDRRFEHCHIVAGSGHGKSQTLQYFIAKDLEAVARGDKTVVVIDSQGDMLKTILQADVLDPNRIVLIDPEDIHHPVCLNLFSVGQDRLESYDPLERERLTNSIIELYDFVLGSLLSAGMTSKQSVVFRYVTRLMFHIPDATIHTLRELLEPGGTAKHRASIEKLEGTPRRFFETEFDAKEFANTRTQVLRRIYGVLENQTFERMFSHPVSKFDMFEEMNAGKLILINTAKSLLKEQGTEIFGRFFIALIAQAAQERATLSGHDRLPVMVYVDEAQDYFDPNIGVILSQARKYKVGMVMAHQYLGQLSQGLQEAFEANTSIKLAGGVSARDARALSGQMGTDAETIQRQPKGTFVTYVRGLTDRGVPMSFPFFVLEKQPKRSAEDLQAIRDQSRAAYAVPWTPRGSFTDKPRGEDARSADALNKLSPSKDELQGGVTTDLTAPEPERETHTDTLRPDLPEKLRKAKPKVPADRSPDQTKPAPRRQKPSTGKGSLGKSTSHKDEVGRAELLKAMGPRFPPIKGRDRSGGDSDDPATPSEEL